MCSSITRKLHRGFAGWTWKRGKKAEEILWGSQTDVWESREMGLFLQADDWNGGKCHKNNILINFFIKRIVLSYNYLFTYSIPEKSKRPK